MTNWTPISEALPDVGRPFLVAISKGKTLHYIYVLIDSGAGECKCFVRRKNKWAGGFSTEVFSDYKWRYLPTPEAE